MMGSGQQRQATKEEAKRGGGGNRQCVELNNTIVDYNNTISRVTDAVVVPRDSAEKNRNQIPSGPTYVLITIWKYWVKSGGHEETTLL